VDDDVWLGADRRGCLGSSRKERPDAMWSIKVTGSINRRRLDPNCLYQ
jgi:hypothetical protein